MNEQPRIVDSPERRFVGVRLTMSLAQNRTRELWQRFGPLRSEVTNRSSPDLASIDIHPPTYFEAFSPTREFEKWAAVEVTLDAAVPAGLESVTVAAGRYAVFIHRGPASLGPQTYGHILGVWLPASGYLLTERPHLAIMGVNYRNDDPDSEEELWIPIQ